MLGPKHTLASVVSSLISGLSDGTIILRKPEHHVELDELRNKLESALHRYRTKERFDVVMSFASFTLSVVSALLAGWVSMPGKIGFVPDGQALYGGFIALIIIITAFFSYRLLRVRESTVELKTFVSLLKHAEREPPENLVKKIDRKLQEVH
jgi:hypothetical protein